MRLEQEDPLTFTPGPGEWETIEAALRESLEHSAAGIREADFGAPANPRRVQLLLEKLGALLKASRAAAGEP